MMMMTVTKTANATNNPTYMAMSSACLTLEAVDTEANNIMMRKLLPRINAQLEVHYNIQCLDLYNINWYI